MRDIKKFFNIRTILCISAAILIAVVFLAFGEADDSPGLGGIGLFIAFVLVMRGIYHTDLLPDGYYIPVTLLILAFVFMICPFVLVFDGEIKLISPIMFAGEAAGVILLIITIVKIRHMK